MNQISEAKILETLVDRFGQMENRFEKIDDHLAQIDKRFDKFDNIESDMSYYARKLIENKKKYINWKRK